VQTKKEALMAITHDEARELITRVMDQPKKFLFGVDKAIENTVLAMFTLVPRDGDGKKELAQAHVYLNDRPGVGKTALLRYLSYSVGAKCSFISGRSDMMPSDIVGGEIMDRATGKRFFVPGPVHSNILLFDEINRTPPKGQAPLLSALEGGFVDARRIDQESQELVSEKFPLYRISPDDERLYFLVMATANPIESEGTYPLSEAEKERFTVSFKMGLPPREEEKKIRLAHVYSRRGIEVENVMGLSEVLEVAHTILESITVSDSAHEYIMRLIENSRPREDKGHKREFADSFLRNYVDMYVRAGNSPRRNFHVEAMARTLAFFRGRDRVTVDDIKEVALLTMSHTILLDPLARGDNVSTDDIVQNILLHTKVPPS
jgi:MoxR-like ATPase